MTAYELLAKHIEYRGVMITPHKAPKGYITRLGDLIVSMPKAKSFLDAITISENMIDGWRAAIGEERN